MEGLPFGELAKDGTLGSVAILAVWFAWQFKGAWADSVKAHLADSAGNAEVLRLNAVSGAAQAAAAEARNRALETLAASHALLAQANGQLTEEIKRLREEITSQASEIRNLINRGGAR